MIRFCSGCAVASRSSTLDSSTDEKVPKLKTSWLVNDAIFFSYGYAWLFYYSSKFCLYKNMTRYNYDNIVTCSRDGSAIIWITKSRKSHVSLRVYIHFRFYFHLSLGFEI